MPGALAPMQARAGRRWLGDRFLLLVAAATVGGLRLWISWGARFPRVIADEAAYLAIGRYLAGGTVWPMGRVATYQPLYGVLTAPWFLLGLGPDGVYRAAIITNAVLGAGLFLVLERFVRQVTVLERPLSVLIAAIGASLPSLLMTSGYAWSDNLTPLLFVVVAWRAVHLTEGPSQRAALAFVGAVLLAYSAHDRFLPLVALALGSLALLRARRRLSTTAMISSAGALLLGTVIVRTVSEHIISRLYLPDRISQTTRNLGRVFDLPALFQSMLGQFWYQAVTTAGLAVVGAVVLARSLWAVTPRTRPRRSHARTPSRRVPLGAGMRPCEPATIVMLVALIGTSFLVSAGFWVRPWMADQLVYGRFNDSFAPILVVLGASGLMAAGELRGRTIAGAGALGVCMLAVLPTALAHRDLLMEPFNGFGILGLLTLDTSATRDIAATAGAGSAATLLIVDASLLAPSARWRRALVAGMAVVVLAVGIMRADRWVGSLPGQDPRSVTDLERIVPAGSRVALSRDAGDPLGRFRTPFYLPDLEFEYVEGPVWEQGSEWVFVPARLDEMLREGYRLAWVDPNSAFGLWISQGERQDRLAVEGRLLPPRSIDADNEDRAAVRVLDGPRASDGDLIARVAIRRPGGAPWPTIGAGAPAEGRIRLIVEVSDRRCGCVVTEHRVDLGGFIAADRVDIELPVRVPLGDLEPGRYRIRFVPVREGVARFGTPAGANITIAPDRG